MTQPRETRGRRTRSGRRSLAVISVALGTLLSGFGVLGVSAAPPAVTDGSEVSHWNQVAATTLIAFPGPNGGAPPAYQINMGMVQGAVYDAVNAIGPKQHQPYLLDKRAARRRQSMRPSRRRRTTCSPTLSRVRPRERRSRVAPVS